MSATGGAIPTGEGATLPQQSWWRQVRLALLSLRHGAAASGQSGFRFYLGMFAGLLSALMIFAPVYVFVSYLRSGVLFLSPPLLLTFLAGWAALPIGTATLGGKLQRNIQQAIRDAERKRPRPAQRRPAQW
jgi:hypothetical protein